MAKYKSTYATEDEIPQEARDQKLYVSRNGRWEFNHEEIEDLDKLVLPGLTANRDSIKGEKTTLATALKTEKDRADLAEAELRKVVQPGTKVVDSKETDLLDEYKKLGAPGDLVKLKGEHADFQSKLQNLEGEKDLRKLCEDTGLNFEATKDFIQSKGQAVRLTVKDVKEKDKSGKDSTVKRAFVSVDVPAGDGKIKVEETSLQDYADKNLPKYLANAIFTADETQQNPKEAPKSTGIKFPKMSGGQNTDGDGTDSDVKTKVASFNESRNSRALPWDKKEQAA